MERIAIRVLNKSHWQKNRFIRFTAIPTAAPATAADAIKSGLCCCNTNERDNNKFNVNEGRNTNNTYQYARSYTSTAAASDLWPVYQHSSSQHSVLSKYFKHQHLFVRHLCAVKATRKKMVSDTADANLFSLEFFVFVNGWNILNDSISIISLNSFENSSFYSYKKLVENCGMEYIDFRSVSTQLRWNTCSVTTVECVWYSLKLCVLSITLDCCCCCCHVSPFTFRIISDMDQLIFVSMIVIRQPNWMRPNAKSY